MAAGPARALRVVAGVLQAPLRLAGLRVDLRLEGCEEAFAALGRYRESSASTPTLAGPQGVTHSLRVRVFPGLPPKLDHLSVEQRGEALYCDGDGLRGEVGPSSAELEVFGGEPALFAALRLCCALWLAPRKGLLLHGACVEPAGSGRSLAFLGPSGAGKSTLSRRLQRAGAHVISDEVTAVSLTSVTDAAAARVDARLFGHPFPRRLGDGLTPPRGLPLAAFAFLSHAAPGAPAAALALSPAQAARALLARVFLPVRSPALVASVLDSCERLAAAAPAFSLSLPDDDRAASAALALLEGGAT